MACPSDLAADDPRHGTLNGYTNLGCRCPEAKAVHAAYMRRRRAERWELARRGRIPDTVVHGKASTRTNWGCGCIPCLKAKYLQDRKRKQRETAT